MRKTERNHSIFSFPYHSWFIDLFLQSHAFQTKAIWFIYSVLALRLFAGKYPYYPHCHPVTILILQYVFEREKRELQHSRCKYTMDIYTGVMLFSILFCLGFFFPNLSFHFQNAEWQAIFRELLKIILIPFSSELIKCTNVHVCFWRLSSLFCTCITFYSLTISNTVLLSSPAFLKGNVKKKKTKTKPFGIQT